MLALFPQTYRFNLLLIVSCMYLQFTMMPIHFQKLHLRNRSWMISKIWNFLSSWQIRTVILNCIHIALITRASPSQLIKTVSNLPATVGSFFPTTQRIYVLFGLELTGILLLLLLSPPRFTAIRAYRKHLRPKTTRRPEPTTVEEPEQFYYKFFGECYVHGMMNGEAISYQNEHRIKAQVFELR